MMGNVRQFAVQIISTHSSHLYAGLHINAIFWYSAVTATGQETARHIMPHNNATCCFYISVLVWITQMRYNAMTSEFQRCWYAGFVTLVWTEPD